MTNQTISISPETLTQQVTSVSLLNVNGGRFAEIRYGIFGEMSVKLDQEDPIAALFAASDAELDRARDAFKRSMRMKSAAWHLIRQRKVAA